MVFQEIIISTINENQLKSERFLKNIQYSIFHIFQYSFIMYIDNRILLMQKYNNKKQEQFNKKFKTSLVKNYYQLDLIEHQRTKQIDYIITLIHELTLSESEIEYIRLSICNRIPHRATPINRIQISPFMTFINLYKQLVLLECDEEQELTLLKEIKRIVGHILGLENRIAQDMILIFSLQKNLIQQQYTKFLKQFDAIKISDCENFSLKYLRCKIYSVSLFLKLRLNNQKQIQKLFELVHKMRTYLMTKNERIIENRFNFYKRTLYLLFKHIQYLIRSDRIEEALTKIEIEEKNRQKTLEIMRLSKNEYQIINKIFQDQLMTLKKQTKQKLLGCIIGQTESKEIPVQMKKLVSSKQQQQSINKNHQKQFDKNLKTYLSKAKPQRSASTSKFMHQTLQSTLKKTFSRYQNINSSLKKIIIQADNEFYKPRTKKKSEKSKKQQLQQTYKKLNNIQQATLKNDDLIKEQVLVKQKYEKQSRQVSEIQRAYQNPPQISQQYRNSYSNNSFIKRRTKVSGKFEFNVKKFINKNNFDINFNFIDEELKYEQISVQLIDKINQFEVNISCSKFKFSKTLNKSEKYSEKDIAENVSSWPEVNMIFKEWINRDEIFKTIEKYHIMEEFPIFQTTFLSKRIKNITSKQLKLIYELKEIIKIFIRLTIFKVHKSIGSTYLLVKWLSLQNINLKYNKFEGKQSLTASEFNSFNNLIEKFNDNKIFLQSILKREDKLYKIEIMIQKNSIMNFINETQNDLIQLDTIQFIIAWKEIYESFQKSTTTEPKQKICKLKINTQAIINRGLTTQSLVIQFMKLLLYKVPSRFFKNILIYFFTERLSIQFHNELVLCLRKEKYRQEPYDLNEGNVEYQLKNYSCGIIENQDDWKYYDIEYTPEYFLLHILVKSLQKQKIVQFFEKHQKPVKTSLNTKIYKKQKHFGTIILMNTHKYYYEIITKQYKIPRNMKSNSQQNTNIEEWTIELKLNKRGSRISHKVTFNNYDYIRYFLHITEFKFCNFKQLAIQLIQYCSFQRFSNYFKPFVQLPNNKKILLNNTYNLQSKLMTSTPILKVCTNSRVIRLNNQFMILLLIKIKHLNCVWMIQVHLTNGDIWSTPFFTYNQLQQQPRLIQSIFEQSVPKIIYDSAANQNILILDRRFKLLKRILMKSFNDKTEGIIYTFCVYIQEFNNRVGQKVRRGRSHIDQKKISMIISLNGQCITRLDYNEIIKMYQMENFTVKKYNDQHQNKQLRTLAMFAVEKMTVTSNFDNKSYGFL